MIRTSKNCNISVIAKQIRFRDCEHLNIYYYCPSDPIIETSHSIAFAPFNFKIPALSELFKLAEFDPSTILNINIRFK